MKIITAAAALLTVTALTPAAPAAAVPHGPLVDRINICQDPRGGSYSALPCVWDATLYRPYPGPSVIIRRSGRMQIISDERAQYLRVNAQDG